MSLVVMSASVWLRSGWISESYCGRCQSSGKCGSCRTSWNTCRACSSCITTGTCCPSRFFSTDSPIVAANRHRLFQSTSRLAASRNNASMSSMRSSSKSSPCVPPSNSLSSSTDKRQSCRESAGSAHAASTAASARFMRRPHGACTTVTGPSCSSTVCSMTTLLVVGVANSCF